jgi:hypothetical protein
MRKRTTTIGSHVRVSATPALVAPDGGLDPTPLSMLRAPVDIS